MLITLRGQGFKKEDGEEKKPSPSSYGDHLNSLF